MKFSVVNNRKIPRDTGSGDISEEDFRDTKQFQQTAAAIKLLLKPGKFFTIREIKLKITRAKIEVSDLWLTEILELLYKQDEAAYITRYGVTPYVAPRKLSTRQRFGEVSYQNYAGTVFIPRY